MLSAFRNAYQDLQAIPSSNVSAGLNPLSLPFSTLSRGKSTKTIIALFLLATSLPRNSRAADNPILRRFSPCSTGEWTIPAPIASIPSPSPGIDEQLPRNESYVVPEDCWGNNIPWPLPGQPFPVIDVQPPQLSIFPRPKTITSMFSIYNFCTYPLWVETHVPERRVGSEKLLAGEKLDRPLESIEYSALDAVSFNLSLIDCLGTDGIVAQTGKVIRNGDTSRCAGHEKGLQLGNDGVRSWQCAAGAWCDDQAYFYEENLCKKENPVASFSQGLLKSYGDGARLCVANDIVREEKFC